MSLLLQLLLLLLLLLLCRHIQRGKYYGRAH